MLLLEKGDGDAGEWYQEIHYQKGVGTDWDIGAMSNLLTANTGLGLAGRIIAGYVWLCNRYRDNKDKIYLCGASRGALIARSIGGWVALHGLLKRKTIILKDDPAILDMYEKYKQKMPADVTVR